MINLNLIRWLNSQFDFFFGDAPRHAGFDFKGKFKLSTTYMYHLDLIHYIRFHISVV